MLQSLVADHHPQTRPLGLNAAAFLLAAAALLLYAQNNDFALGVHPDEIKKVRFILSGQQDFMHPILMLQSSRAANAFLGLTDFQDVVEMGRTISAAFGALFVFIVYVLARRVLPSTDALIATAVTALVPLTALHAQVLKEDIYAAPFVMLSLVAIMAMVRQANLASALAFGAAFGLAISAKTISGLILPVALAAPLVCRVESVRRYLTLLPLSLVLAAAIWALVNSAAFVNPDAFMAGTGYELSHATTGHFGKSDGPFDDFFTHYLRKELPRGLGPLLVVAGLIGAVVAATRWRTLDDPFRILLVFAGVWYFAHELSPMKPNVSRYMLSLGPAVVILALWMARRAAERFTGARKAQAFAAAAVLMALWPAAQTLAHVATAPDTSNTAERIARSLNGAILVDRGMWSERPNDLGLIETARKHGYDLDKTFAELNGDWDFAATRNIKGNRYVAGEKDAPRIRDLFARLYRQGYVEVRHALAPYEFRNRAVRIVALRGGVDRLRAAAAEADASGLVSVVFHPPRGTSATANRRGR